MKTIAIISAFPPSQNSLNEYGYHLAINFAADPRVEKVVIIADELDEPLEEWALGPKIEVRRIWRFNKISTIYKLAKELHALKPDLALYNVQTASFGDRELTAALGLMTPFATRLLGVYSGVLAHNMITGVDLEDTVLKGQKIRQAIVKLGGNVVSWFIMKANYVTVTLSSYYDEFSKSYPKADLTMVPHGTFDTDVKNLTPYLERERIIVTMGKFGTYKRLETLLKAMDILRETGKYDDVKLVIGGTDHPNFKGYMKSLEDEHGHKDELVFHGYVAEEDIPDFFGQAQVSVFDYSSTTGSSGVLHQTASYLATPVFPAIGDFVDVCNAEGITGENYKPNDPTGMAAAIMRVFDSPKEAEDIGKANKLASGDMPMSKIIDFHLSKVE